MKTWTEIAAATHPQILAWAETQPWARAMAACQQDAGWHAEGDVWTHTRMVCAELEKLEAWPQLDPTARLKLLLTALFHDSGKPATTAFDPETGRTRSLNHSLVGMGLGRQVLRELGCALALREEICALVRYHGRPPYLLEKKSPEHEIIKLSWLVNHRLLHLFALADTRGRDSIEMTRPEETVHLWRELAAEQGCLDGPFPFANDHARFLFYRDKLSSLHYTPREDYRCVVTVMSGLPGAGKDTWLARHRPQLPVVSLDEVREDLDVDSTDNQGTVVQEARERCRQQMRAGTDFAFNATNLTTIMRQRWINLFADYGARIEIVYVEPPLRKILEQNKQRERVVPEKVIRRLLEKTEPPTMAEAHAVTLTSGAE
jgi:putative nucleotidyltransferase with HDIG domain